MSDSDSYAYVGAQDAGTAVHEYNVRDLHIQKSLTETRTVLSVKVVRAPYDKDGNDIPPGTVGPIGFIDVQPMVNQVDGVNNGTGHGTIYRRPYFRCQSSLGAVISDPVLGDIGEYVVHDRDTSVVISTGKQSNPGSRRMHDLADGVYHGQQQAGAPNQYVTFTSGGIVFGDKNSNTITFADNLITIKVRNATYTFDQNGNFKASGNVVAGQGSSDQVGLQTHTHADPSEGNTNAPNAGT
jgi:hypothetical protein